jgi:cytochrome c biogenesis protein CcmG, thiol:disulfide interchange protein DsbE
LISKLVNNMENYYQVLGIAEQASTLEVTEAYTRQQARYNPERALDDDMRQRAEQRTVEIHAAYATLADPAQRQAYDAELAAQRVQPAGRAVRTGVTRREIVMSAAGALVGLVLIVIVWTFSARTAEPTLPPIGEVNRVAPDFALPGLDGGTVRLSDYRGQVVLINFWGTWCEPCKEETPALQAIHQELSNQGLTIIGVNLYSQETSGDQPVRDFLAEYAVTYPIALDTDGATARAFQISPIPVSYFVDPNGTIRFVKVGTLRADEVRTLFERLQPRASAQP